mgnify:CR=1 FL=1
MFLVIYYLACLYIQIPRDLLIEIVVAGDGVTYPNRNRGDYVTIHYTGYLPDKSIFDSTKRRGAPFSFHVGREEVISGLDLAVSQLSEKEIAQVTIPAYLAYGKRGFPAL